MPTLAELTVSVYRDLADEAKAVFSQLQVEDFIRGGIADLNRVAPLDTYDDLALTIDPDTGVVTAWTYPTVIEQPYRVEVRRYFDGWTWVLDSGEYEEGGQAVGWMFKRGGIGGTIEFPQWWIAALDPVAYAIRIHGYAARPLPYTTDPDPDLSPPVALSETEEYSVRAKAKSDGYDLLSHDRALFAQWQGQTNNTDVSPTQMMQMAANSKQEWDRQRGLIRTVRRV